jgi:hypothetical protein
MKITFSINGYCTATINGKVMLISGQVKVKYIFQLKSPL